MKRYLLVKVGVSALTGVLVYITLSILKVDLALVFALFSFLFNFIPNVGSIIATLLPLPVVLLSPDMSLTRGLLALAIPGVIQFAIGNVVEPKVMGKSLGLHPVVVLCALVFWGVLWGFIGMLLAVPMTAVIKIILERNAVTRPIADFMAGEHT